MVFCDKLQTLRKRMDLTQEDLANRLGVTRQTVSKWESGAAYPEPEKISMLCDILDISPDVLFDPAKGEDALSTGTRERLELSALGDNIKRYRMARNIPQETFADMLGVSRQSVSKWESGSVVPKTEMIVGMLQCLNVSFSALFLPLPEVEAGDAVKADTPVTTAPDAACDARAPEQDPGDSAPAAGKPKHPKKWIKWVIIPIASLLAACLVLAGILFLPFAWDDPLGSTVSALFSEEISTVSALQERWVRDGAVMTVGSGETSFSLRIHQNEDYVAIGGMTELPDDELLLPRKGIGEAFAQSVFAPDSGSAFAMEQEDFDQMVRFLNSTFATDSDTAKQDTLDHILESIEAHASAKTTYAFAKNGFGLAQTVTLRFNQKKLIAILEDIIPAIEKDPVLNNSVQFGISTATEEETGMTLAALLASVKESLQQSDLGELSLLLSYTVEGGRIVNATVSTRTVDADGTVSDVDIHLDLVYNGKNAEAHFEMVIAEKMTVDGSLLESSIKLTLAITSTEREDTVTVLFDNRIEIRASYQDNTREENTENKVTLTYNRADKRYAVDVDAPEGGGSMHIEGVYEMDTEQGIFRLSVDRFETDGTAAENFAAFDYRISACPSGTAFPSHGRALHQISAGDLHRFLRELPAKKIATVLEGIVGSAPAWKYTEEGKLIPFADEIEARTEELAQMYVKYSKTNDAAQKAPVRAIYLYDEQYDIYVRIFMAPSSSVCRTSHSYTLTEEIRASSHEARIVDGVLEVHQNEVISQVDPTCHAAGSACYRCTVCNVEYTVTLERLSHNWEVGCQLPAAQYDNGESLSARVDRCTHCGLVNTYEVGGTTIRFSDNGDGTQSISKYNAGDGSAGAKFFCIPSDHLAAMGVSLTDIRMETDYAFSAIRVPTGVRTLKAYTFMGEATLDLQVLVLPRGLEKIEANAFGNLSTLRVVFFEGTREEWETVGMGDYRALFEEKEIIFVPEGVTGERVNQYVTSYDLLRNAVGALHVNALEDKNHSYNAATSAANAGVRAPEIPSGHQVLWCLYDESMERLVVCCESHSGEHMICIYDADTCDLILSFEAPTYMRGARYADGGYLVTANSGNSFTLYDTVNGTLLQRYVWLPQSNPERLLLVDGRVYAGSAPYAGSAWLYTYDIGTYTGRDLIEYTTSEEIELYVSRAHHRMIVLHNGLSTSAGMHKLAVFNTQTGEIFTEKTVAQPWDGSMIGYGYVKGVYDDKTWYYSLASGSFYEADSPALAFEEPHVPALSAPYVFLDLASELQCRAAICFDESANVWIALRRQGDDADQRITGFFANEVLPLSNGGVLLYMRDSYSLLVVYPV